MTASQPSSPTQLTGQDLIRLKKYLSDGLSRALEAEGIPAAQRNTFIQQSIVRIYEQTQLKLSDDLKKEIFTQVLNDLLGFGPLQTLLDDVDVTEIMVNGP